MTEPAVAEGDRPSGVQPPLRILVASPYLPFPPQQGFALRVHYLVRELHRRNQVTLLAYDSRGHRSAAAAYRELGIGVRTVPPLEQRRWMTARKLRATLSSHSLRWHERYSRRMADEIEAALAHQPFDVIQLESAEFWRYDFGSEAAVVFDAHNIWYELRQREAELDPSRLGRLYRGRDVRALRTEEEAAWARMDGILVTSDREARIAAPHARPGRVEVAANGIDPTYMQPSAVEPAAERLVFTGTIVYRPNADAVRYFVSDILPLIHRRRPGTTLAIVGKDVPRDIERLASDRIEVTGWVPDVRPYLARATVVIAPLRAGSGTRIKILEAFAMGRPVVSTSRGCEGLEVRDGEHLLIADDPASFAEAAIRLMDDSLLARRLGSAGRALVEARYAWSGIAEGVEAFYRRIIAERRGEAT